MPSAIGGIAGGLFGGSTPSAPNVQTFQPSGTQAFDKLIQSMITQQSGSNPYSQYMPQATATFNMQSGNANAPGYQTAANNAGSAFNTVGNQAVGASVDINKAALAGLPAASQVLNMGFDPNNALYQRTLQQLNDLVNVNEASRGVTNSPYGASVANTADANFNIDWQNNQLDRALKALSGYTSGVQGAASGAAQAGQVGTAGAGAINNAGAVPFNATNTISENQSAALNQLLNILGIGGSQAFNQNTINDLMQYLNLGANQANQQGNFDLQNFQNKLAQSQVDQAGTGNLVGNGAMIASTFL